MFVRAPDVPVWIKTLIFRVFDEFPGIVIEVTPELLSVTPAKKRKAPVALADGINDIIFDVKSVPFANRTNDIPDDSVSLISSTTIFVLLLLVSLISKVMVSPGEYFADAQVLVTLMLLALRGTMIFFPVNNVVSLLIPLIFPALPPCSPQTNGAIRIVSFNPTILQLYTTVNG